MLEANKSKWFEKLFSIYNRNLIKRRFNSFNTTGLEQLLNRNKDVPTIIIANHSSWWDGLVVFQIIQKTDMEFFVMMEEKQLNDLQLFRKLGAFSVVRENPRSAIKSINYSIELLKSNPNNMLLIFPQGEILPSDVRPIKFFNGVSRIAEKIGNCEVFCISMCYEFLGEFKPDIFVKVSNTKFNDSINLKQRTNEYETHMTHNLDKLKQMIVNVETDNFVNII